MKTRPLSRAKSWECGWKPSGSSRESPIDLLDFGNPWIMDGVALVYLAAVIALASVTYRYVEVPGYDAAKRFVNRRSHAVPGTTRHQVSRG